MPLRAVVKDRIKITFWWALLAIALLLLPPRSWAQAGVAPGAATQARITAAIDESQLTTLRGNTHPLARREFDQGAAPASLPMRRMLLVLQRSPAQEAALAALLEQQQDKSSPNYRHWLTPAQVGQQFGPAEQDIQTVTLWLQSHGFQVAKVAQSRMVIEFSGTASQILQAFHTQIHKYTVSGKDHWANASDPQIPVALAPVVAGIDTLHNFPRKPMHHVAGAFARSKETGAAVPVHPEFTYPGGCGPTPSSPCYAVGPADFAKIYDVPNLLLNPAPTTVLNGTGVTIAIVGRSNIDLQDVQDFRTLFGLPANPPNIVLNGPDPLLVSGDETEADLDVEWAGAVAPAATIDLVVSESTLSSDGADLSAEYIVDNNLAPILSSSYGACELSMMAAGNQFYSQMWEQAAAQGITVTISTGDSGSAGCDNNSGSYPQPAQSGLQVSGIASTPYNIAVGGTDFNDLNDYAAYWNTTSPTTNATLESALGYIPETTWNDTCTNAESFSLTSSVTAEANCNALTGTNQDFIVTVGGGGGKSNCTNGDGSNPTTCGQGYAKPSWQNVTGVPADSRRDVPDVSLFAADGLNGNFYLICESDYNNSGPCSASNVVGVGGTSVAAPSFAAIMALVNQQYGPQGNANWVLYKLAGQGSNTCVSVPNPASTCVFYDVQATPQGNSQVTWTVPATIAMPCAKGSTSDCTLTNNNDSYGVLSGYAAGTGYDLATGLGSVNVASLVNAWATAQTALAATTSTLTLNSGNPVSITHGQSVSVSIGVTGTAGTPTGDASLIAQTGSSGQTAVEGYTLSSGSVSSSTTFLPGGSYNVIAHYAGNGTFGASDSNAVPVTVNPANSRLQAGIVTFSPTTGAITSTTATSFAYGSPYILRMDILKSSGSCQPLVTSGVITGCAFDARGSVNVTDTFNSVTGPLDAGTFAVNSDGSAEDQPIQLAAGTHTVQLTYSGDNSYTGAGPVTLSLTVSKATTATSVASNPTTTTSGGTVTLTAVIISNSNSSAGPSGTVQFLSNGSNLGAAATCTPAGATATAGASCLATLTTTISTLPPGLIEMRQRPGPPAMLIWLAAFCVLICLLLSLRLPSRHRGYAYAGLVFFLLLGIAGCGGGGSGSGGTTSTARSITANYSGDANYSSSASLPISITLQ